MSEAVECPQCGDTFAGHGNLRGHVNGSPDHPSWGEIQSLLKDDQAETSDEEGADQAKSSDSGDSDEENDQAEGATKRQKGPQAEAPEGDENVPTEKELQKQREQAGTDQGKSSDGRDPETNDDQGEEQGKGAPEGTETAGSALALPGVAVLEDLDTTTLALLGALLLVVVIAWYYLGDSRDMRGPSGGPEGPSEGGSDSGSEDASSDDVRDEADEVPLLE